VSLEVYKVVDGKLTVMAEVAEKGEELVIDDSPTLIKQYEAELAKQSQFTPAFEAINTKLLRKRAKLEVNPRTHDLN